MKPEIDTHNEFKKHLATKWKQKAFCNRTYILTNELKEWMKEKRGSATNCAKLLHAEYFDHDRTIHHPIQASDVCSEDECCCLVFSILIEIGHGKLLDIFHAAKILDSNLHSADYYYNDLRELLSGANIFQTDIDNIIDDFDYSKRAYCPVELKPRSGRFHHGKWILPICRKRRINNKGGTAALSQILVKSEVLSEDLKEKVPHAAINDVDFGWCYQFALKEYSLDNEDSYKWEKQAFRLFVRQEGMVQYLGDFTYDEEDSHSRTFNILLEYGELDLDEHFAEVRPPRLSSEIHEFWSDLFEVAKALEKFHNIEQKYDDGRNQHISGWHADVKPDNILSVRGSFVLADFGFARFQKNSTKSDDEPALETLTGGTVTYGAPETDAIRRGEALLKSVMQTIDIWSFGCVLSMAATWVVFGFQGIIDYEAVRRRAISVLRDNDEPGPVADDAFHNGTRVLSKVLTWHAYLRENMRKSDVTTERVLNLIEKHMLLEDPRARIDSAMLCSKLAGIVELSKHDVDARAGPMTTVFINLLTDIDIFATYPNLSSQAIPSHDAVKLAPRNSLFAPTGSARLPSRTGSPSDRQIKKSQRINAIPRLKTTVRNTRRFGVPSKNIDVTPMLTKRRLSMTNPNPTLTLTEASDLLGIALSETDDGLNKQILFDEDHAPIFEPPNVLVNERSNDRLLENTVHYTNGQEHEEADMNPVRPSVSPLQPLDPSSGEPPATTPGTIPTKDLYDLPSSPNVRGKGPLGSSEYSTLVNSTSDTKSPSSSEPRLDPSPSGSQYIVKEKSSGEHMSPRGYGSTISVQPALPTKLDIVQVREQLDAKMEKKSHKIRDRLGRVKADPHLENYIKDRDIAFVVDNGTTMVPHWKDVLFTLETLYLKLDGLDENGVDLIFTEKAKTMWNKAELKKSWGRTTLVRHMNEAQPVAANTSDERVRTNMKEVLSPIFQRFFTSRQNKRMTLIVLTDGMWEGSIREEDVAEKIRDFYNSWHEKWHVVEDRWFSIQFVSFGDNEAALRRLQVLDDDMGAIYKIPDFVDTEPWTGSVMKMITGSLSDEDDARAGGDRSPPAKTPAFTSTDLARNGTVKSSRLSIFSSKRGQARPS
ncbi:hypothetical protein BLS_001043 [Venturia inaequalis]|uniref:Protein kinase domain-containing protein n=1 Tax=Venturia inaequalis TaxID=5025 RepID=A0A8H3V939_VENIN|nr:hypothetical protein BLS_001043 [Venturia inaequalis]KAE9983610.1 hypothetical protein EG328_009778 [Venturia inaequalis]KAE9990125.1 hypothetical protein EG327_001855 [Venturia inaequalis]RDI79440.1 hypothetical protein Vi05172_g10589 [Venturia inaequalis]